MTSCMLLNIARYLAFECIAPVQMIIHNKHIVINIKVMLKCSNN